MAKYTWPADDHIAPANMDDAALKATEWHIAFDQYGIPRRPTLATSRKETSAATEKWAGESMVDLAMKGWTIKQVRITDIKRDTSNKAISVTFEIVG